MEIRNVVPANVRVFRRVFRADNSNDKSESDRVHRKREQRRNASVSQKMKIYCSMYSSFACRNSSISQGMTIYFYLMIHILICQEILIRNMIKSIDPRSLVFQSVSTWRAIVSKRSCSTKNRLAWTQLKNGFRSCVQTRANTNKREQTRKKNRLLFVQRRDFYFTDLFSLALSSANL